MTTRFVSLGLAVGAVALAATAVVTSEREPVPPKRSPETTATHQTDTTQSSDTRPKSDAALKTDAPPKMGAALKTGPAQLLFDGKTLAGWVRTEFEGDHDVKVDPAFREGRGAIVLEPGTTLSGITWRDGSTLPKVNYEVSLEAMRVTGGDFFCGLTFPVGSSACTFVVGGWGGTVVGLSSIDHVDASGNETTREREFADGQWYRIRVRVTPGRIEAWIDDEQVVDFPTEGRRIALRPGPIAKSLPLGIAAYQTRAALRDIRLRRW